MHQCDVKHAASHLCDILDNIDLYADEDSLLRIIHAKSLFLRERNAIYSQEVTDKRNAVFEALDEFVSYI